MLYQRKDRWVEREDKGNGGLAGAEQATRDGLGKAGGGTVILDRAGAARRGGGEISEKRR